MKTKKTDFSTEDTENLLKKAHIAAADSDVKRLTARLAKKLSAAEELLEYKSADRGAVLKRSAASLRRDLPLGSFGAASDKTLRIKVTRIMEGK